MITKLLEVRGKKPGKNVQLSEDDVKYLCTKSREIFISQPNLLELEAPIKICGKFSQLSHLVQQQAPKASLCMHNNWRLYFEIGDVHGQYYDLLRIFEYGGFPPEANYLFLGDYIDRGKQSIETVCLLLCYKIKYPENFFMLRGNHECAQINRIYGFYDECKRRYSIRLWRVFSDVFNCLPVAALVDEKIFCMHGGLSPELKNLD